MKISERWLREWVNPAVDASTLAHKLNMAGLECEAAPLLRELPRGVVVGRIVSIAPHPDAERLRICEVDVGDTTPRRIVCGAANAASNLRVPAALPGATLPGGVTITETELRGVTSAGMLCSAAELSLADKSDGLLELDADARPGTPIEQHLRLDDQVLDLDLTPNRGDCLSVSGLAREVAALYGLQLLGPGVRAPVVSVMDACEVTVEDSHACPHYVGRVVSGIKPGRRTPDWMRERLRRSGIRSIHPLVDITNYVMLELGQPMHAFDCARLDGALRVRRARAGETLALLNEQTVTLTPDDLVIGDARAALALAGVMGGSASAVGAETTSVFLESACFNPISIAGNGRRHKLLSDSRYRFERGVDPALQRRALDRATQLIIELCGGEAGPVTEVGRAPASGASITLRQARVDRLLGVEIPPHEMVAMLSRLGVETLAESAGAWRARAPTFRYDLRVEADLVEEIGRLYGYDRIPARAVPVELAAYARAETKRPLDGARDLLVARGYREIVSYSFVDPQLQTRLTPEVTALALDNPIAETMGVMRTTLWSGLLPAWQYNRQRQRQRARIFETGRCFLPDKDGVREQRVIAGLIAGEALPEHWDSPRRRADFYDVKADVEALAPAHASLTFEPAEHAALHPGRSARIRLDDAICGWLGELHPRLCQQLDLDAAPLLFELDWDLLESMPVPRYARLSEHPSVRRDLALVVPEAVPAQALVDCARTPAGGLLQRVHVFDVYRGPALEAGFKSVALGLIFQDYSSTLTDIQVDAAVAEIAARLGKQLGASIRGG